MNEARIITANTEDELWQQFTSDLSAEAVFEYDVILQQGAQQVELHLDIDLGGGFEGGFELTWLKSILSDTSDFRFGLHKEHFLDEIGKFFGMQDVVIGHPEFDKHVVVKTNDEAKVKELFANDALRTFLQSLEEDFTFGITSHDHKRLLEFSIEKGVTDAAELKLIYHHFHSMLIKLGTTGSAGVTT